MLPSLTAPGHQAMYVCCCTPVAAYGAEWPGLGGAAVPAPRTLLYALLELPRGGGTEQGWPCT